MNPLSLSIIPRDLLSKELMGKNTEHRFLLLWGLVCQLSLIILEIPPSYSMARYAMIGLGFSLEKHKQHLLPPPKAPMTNQHMFLLRIIQQNQWIYWGYVLVSFFLNLTQAGVKQKEPQLRKCLHQIYYTQICRVFLTDNWERTTQPTRDGVPLSSCSWTA